jgi:hypothetical protein
MVRQVYLCRFVPLYAPSTPNSCQSAVTVGIAGGLRVSLFSMRCSWIIPRKGMLASAEGVAQNLELQEFGDAGAKAPLSLLAFTQWLKPSPPSGKTFQQAVKIAS